MNCCDYCGKKLRKCKKVDIPDRTTHFKCLDKINQERYNEQMEKLKELMREGINKIILKTDNTTIHNMSN
jgi:alanine racemase